MRQAWRVAHPPARGHWWLASRPLVHHGFYRSWVASGLNRRAAALFLNPNSAPVVEHQNPIRRACVGLRCQPGARLSLCLSRTACMYNVVSVHLRAQADSQPCEGHRGGGVGEAGAHARAADGALAGRRARAALRARAGHPVRPGELPGERTDSSPVARGPPFMH